MSEKKPEGGFKVTDRRIFTSDGEVKEEAAVKRQWAASGAGDELASRESASGAKDPPQADFGSFIISLATSGMVHLGEIPDPASGKRDQDLEGARQMIDILGILREKTEGNLSAEESRLLDGLLYELRMKYLEKKKVVKL